MATVAVLAGSVALVGTATASPAGAMTILPGVSMVPDFIPAWMVGATTEAAAPAAGRVILVGGATVAGCAVVCTVVGGVATGYAVGTAARDAVTWAWGWAGGHDPAYGDPGPPVGQGDGWSVQGLTTSDTAGGTSTITLGVVDFDGSYVRFPVGATTPAWGAKFQVRCPDGTPKGGSSGGHAAGATIEMAAYGCEAPGPQIEVFPVVGGAFTTTPGSRWSAPVPAPAPAPTPAPGTTPLTTTPTSRCSDGSTATGSPVTYTGATAVADLPPITYPACPVGTMPSQRSTPTVRADGTAVTSPLPTWTAPVVPAAFPECQPFGACALTLTRRAPTGQGTQLCNDTSACAGWQTQPRTGPTGQVLTMPDATPTAERAPAFPDGSYVECLYGPYRLPASECAPVATEPSAPAAPAPGTAGKNCDGGDLSLNPVSWVVVPVKCLFVPSEGTLQAAHGAASGGWTATKLPAWGGSVGAVGGGLAAFGGAGSDGCAGPHFEFVLRGSYYAFDPLYACDGPMRNAAVVFKLFASIAVVVCGARFCARPILSSFGMGGAV